MQLGALNETSRSPAAAGARRARRQAREAYLRAERGQAQVGDAARVTYNLGPETMRRPMLDYSLSNYSLSTSPFRLDARR
jgi:hypothetical protein